GDLVRHELVRNHILGEPGDPLWSQNGTAGPPCLLGPHGPGPLFVTVFRWWPCFPITATNVLFPSTGYWLAVLPNHPTKDQRQVVANRPQHLLAEQAERVLQRVSEDPETEVRGKENGVVIIGVYRQCPRVTSHRFQAVRVEPVMLVPVERVESVDPLSRTRGFLQGGKDLPRQVGGLRFAAGGC